MTAALQDLSVYSPPPWVGRFASDDLDEIRDFVASSDGEHSRAANGTGPLGFEYAWARGSDYKFQWVRMRVGQTIRVATPVPTLHLLMPLGNRYRVGRREHVASGHSIMLLAPGWEYTRSGPMGARFGATVSADLLAREVEARQALRRGSAVLRTQMLDLPATQHATLMATALDVAFSTHPDADARMRRHAEARLTALIADLMLTHGTVKRARAVSSARMAALEAWIDGHLDEPLTVGRLCAVSGVGERCLQKEFLLRRGMSPLRFVTERRLAAARDRLKQGRPGDDVTSIALELGFAHVGRFAQQYRHAFGELPSQSLRRSAAVAGRPSTPMAAGADASRRTPTRP